MKKIVYLLPFALTAMSSCENQLICDMSFQTVGFTWSDSTHLPDRVDVVIRETNDSLFSDHTGWSGYYLVATDEHQSLFYKHTYTADVFVYDANDSLLTQNEWLITADECHIQKVSGPEILP